MSKIILDCIEDDCTFQTQEVEHKLAIQLLTLYVNTQHAKAAGTGDSKQSAQTERVKKTHTYIHRDTLEQE